MQIFSFIAAMLMGVACYAHQPELSTTVLSETANGIQVLQVASSLAAFEGEIHYLYGEKSYQNADEFRELVVDHFEKNILFVINGADTVKFKDPQVVLGHETKLVAEVLNIPPQITSLRYQNSMFRDMPHNKMQVILLLEGFPRDRLVLNDKNQQAMKMVRKNGNWEQIEMAPPSPKISADRSAASDGSESASSPYAPYFLLTILFGTILSVLYFWTDCGKRKAV